MEAISVISAVTEIAKIVTDALKIFVEPPAIYFVAVALFSAGAGVARKFVPMRRR